MKIPCEQVVNRLREANFTHKRQAPNVDLWRQKGTQKRVSVPRRDLLEEGIVKVILHQAGLTDDEILAFIVAAIK